MIIPNIWENRKCSKPPTRYVYTWGFPGIWVPQHRCFIQIGWFGGSATLGNPPYGITNSAKTRDPPWSRNTSHEARPGNGGRSYFVGFRYFGNTSYSFPFCIHYGMHVPFILHAFPVIFLHSRFTCIYFTYFPFHIPLVFIPMYIHVLSSSFHLHACSFHFVFMSFHFLSKVMKMALWLGQGTECNKCFSLRYR